MGDAKRRGTYAERKAAPLGPKANHAQRHIKAAIRRYLQEARSKAAQVVRKVAS